MVPAPEVDATKQGRPRLGAGVPGVRLDQPSVGSPHHLLELPELTQETGVTVVDPLGIGGHHRVRIGLDVPDTVGQGTTTGTGDFLLFPAPVRKFHLVGEENTASHDMHKLELGLNGAQTLLSLFTFRQGLDNLDPEQIIGVTGKSLVSIGRDLELPVSLGHGGTFVMRVNSAVSETVVESDDASVLNEVGGQIVPCVRTRNFAVWT